MSFKRQRHGFHMKGCHRERTMDNILVSGHVSSTITREHIVHGGSIELEIR